MTQQRYKRLAPDGLATVDAASRVVRYVFSDESVGRDGHVVKADAWQMKDFAANPVFLWAHDDTQPPIGRVFDLHTQSRQLVGGVKYAETELADSIYELVRTGYLNATSCSWRPLSYEPRSGGAGMIFTSVDLLEISQVAIPALPTALATARSRGLNVKPIAEWAGHALDSAARPQRSLIEAIYRSASPKRKTMSVNKQTARTERERRARVAIALQLKDGPATRAATATSAHSDEALQEVQGHHKRCLEHHAEIGRANDKTGDGLDALAEVHRRLTSTLEELGYGRSAKSPKVLEAMERCMRSLGDAHEKATEAHGELGEALGDATGCVEDLMGDEEEDDDGQS